MKKEFSQQVWNFELESDLKQLIQTAIWEDGRDRGDLTSSALIPADIRGKASVMAREDGVAAGLVAVKTLLKEVDPELDWLVIAHDSDLLKKGDKLGEIVGPVQCMLTAERLLLNFVGRLSGIASLTQKYVQAIKGTNARIYDTRKTTLGWRRLEKYAVRCGGGNNHRSGLFDAVLIKDNHLAFGNSTNFNPAQAVQKAKSYLNQRFVDAIPIIEVEVDSLEQLKLVLPENPDIVLLDNMNAVLLQEAVQIRNEKNPAVELEASGGITLQTVREAALAGVERISVGALTHSAKTFDIGLDWEYTETGMDG
ncbi:MAG: carboxylating nicotinate-nucleotide diphosphorylase [Planctomycetia bacterium]|nr:carboxylating nicotinate-nucleotide diphosphorylase [Planctomycetia bacterium]